MGRDTWHHLSVTGVSHDEVMTLLKDVDETKPEDFVDQTYGGKAFLPEEYHRLVTDGITVKANTVNGFHCATIQWLSHRFPSAMFVYSESSYDLVDKTIYVGGKRCEYNNGFFIDYLVEKLGINHDTLLKEYAERYIAINYDENGNPILKCDGGHEDEE